jgi:parallel beta-helix repeat protein
MTAIRFLRYAALCLLLGIFGCGLPDPARAAEEPGPSAALFAAPFYSCARNFYVATTGNDTNAGTQSSPWQTIQHADSSSRAAGDCVNVAPGTYKANVLITHGGNAPTASGYVVYRCQTLDGCHVLAPGGGPLWGISQPANFVVVDGFELDGNNALQTDGIASVCLLTSGDTYGTGNASHHIWALNNIAHHCNLAGIALQNKEWFYTMHNTVYHNSYTSGYQGSGLAYVVVQCIESGNAACASGSTYKGGTGTYTPSGMDLTFAAPFHNVVFANNVYDNSLGANNPVACGSHTDGNGIIMDTFLDETTNTVVYPYQTLVEGNVSYNNGGRGIHVFRTSNTTVANNTVYANGKDTCMNSYGLGDLSQAGGSNNVWVNNIAQSVVTAANPSCGQFCGNNNIPLIAGDAAGFVDSNNTFLDNITYGGVGAGPLTSGSTGVGLYNNDASYFSTAKNMTNKNPMLMQPTAANFALQAGSPAISHGATESYLPSTSVDIGGCASSLTTCQ